MVLSKEHREKLLLFFIIDGKGLVIWSSRINIQYSFIALAGSVFVSTEIRFQLALIGNLVNLFVILKKISNLNLGRFRPANSKEMSFEH